MTVLLYMDVLSIKDREKWTKINGVFISAVDKYKELIKTLSDSGVKQVKNISFLNDYFDICGRLKYIFSPEFNVPEIKENFLKIRGEGMI